MKKNDKYKNKESLFFLKGKMEINNKTDQSK